MSKALPEPTTDLDRAKHDLEEFGYCLIADAMSASQCVALRDRLIEQAAAEREVNRATRDGGPGLANQRVWNLVNKGQVFRDLVLHPLVTDLMTHLLGPNFILSSLTANIAGPGGEAMILHRDQGYLPFYTPLPVVANIAWMLDDVTAANGGTRLVPGSHRVPAMHLDPELATRAISAEGPAGSALVFDGRVFHGTGANTTKALRRVLLSYFSRFFIRQQENMFLSIDPEIPLSDELKARLGYRVTGTLGGVEGPKEGEIVRRPSPALGELHSGARASAAPHPL